MEVALGYALKENSGLEGLLASAVAKAEAGSNNSSSEGLDSNLQDAYISAWKASDTFSIVQKLGNSVSTTGGPSGTLLASAPVKPLPSTPSSNSSHSQFNTPPFTSPGPSISCDFTVNLPRTAVSGYPQYHGPSSIYERPSKPLALSLVLQPSLQSVSQLPESTVASEVRPAFEWLKSIPLQVKIDLANYYFFFVHSWIPIVDRELILDLIKATSIPQISPKLAIDSLLHASNIALITNIMALSMQMKQNQAKSNSKDTKAPFTNMQPKTNGNNDKSDPNMSTPASTLIALCASVLPHHLAETGIATGSQQLVFTQARLLYVLLLLRKGFNSDAWIEVGNAVRSAYTLGIHVFGVENSDQYEAMQNSSASNKKEPKVKIKLEKDVQPASHPDDNERDTNSSHSGRTPKNDATPPSRWTKRTWFACCIMDTLVAAVLGRLPNVRDCDFEATSLLSTNGAWEEWLVLSEPCPTSSSGEERSFVPKQPRKLFSDTGKLIVKDLESSDLSTTVYGPTQAAWLAKPVRGITVYNSLFKLIRLLNIFLYRINKPSKWARKSSKNKSEGFDLNYRREGDGDGSDEESEYMTKPSDMYGEEMRNDFAQRVHKWSQNNLHTSCKKDVITYGLDGCQSCTHTTYPASSHSHGGHGHSHSHTHGSDSNTSPDLSLDCNNAHTVVMSPHALNLHLTFSAVLALMIRFDSISVLDCYDSSLPYAAFLMPTNPDSGLPNSDPRVMNGNLGGLAGNVAFGGDSFFGNINVPQPLGSSVGSIGASNVNINNENDFSTAFSGQNNMNYSDNGFNNNTSAGGNDGGYSEQNKNPSNINFGTGLGSSGNGFFDNGLDFSFDGFDATEAGPSSPANSTGTGSSWDSWSSQPVYILPHSLPRHVTMKLTGYARFYTVHAAPPFFAYYSALALALAVDQFKSVAQSVAQSASRQQQLATKMNNMGEMGSNNNNQTSTFFGGLGGNIGLSNSGGYSANSSRHPNGFQSNIQNSFMNSPDVNSMGSGPNMNGGQSSFNFTSNGSNTPDSNNTINLSYLQSEMSLVAGLLGIAQSYYWVDSTWNLKGGTIRLESAEIQKKRQQVDKTLAKLKRSLFGVMNSGIHVNSVVSGNSLNRSDNFRTNSTNGQGLYNNTHSLNSERNRELSFTRDNGTQEANSGSQVASNNACDNLLTINNSAALAMSLMGNINNPENSTISSVGTDGTNSNNSPNTPQNLNTSGSNTVNKNGSPVNSRLSGNSNYGSQHQQPMPAQKMTQQRVENTNAFLSMLEAAANGVNNENLSPYQQQQLQQKLNSVMGLLGMNMANNGNNTLSSTVNENVNVHGGINGNAPMANMQMSGFDDPSHTQNSINISHQMNNNMTSNTTRNVNSVENLMRSGATSSGMNNMSSYGNRHQLHDDSPGQNNHSQMMKPGEESNVANVPEFLQNLGVMTE